MFTNFLLLSFVDYRKVRLYVATKPFKGRMISVQQLSSTSSIIIYPTHGLSNDLPMFYFENPKRSGGGTILNYKPNPTDGFTVIEFQDRQGLCFYVFPVLYSMTEYGDSLQSLVATKLEKQIHSCTFFP